MSARQARLAAGLTLAAAARQARLSARYVAHCERHGAPYVTAVKLARIYGCRIDNFLRPGGRTPERHGGGRRHTDRPQGGPS